MATDPGVARSLCTLTGTFRLGHLVANYYYFLKLSRVPCLQSAFPVKDVNMFMWTTFPLRLRHFHPEKTLHASVMCLIFVNALQTLKYIPGKDILPTFDTSGCSSLRRLGYQTNAQVAKKCCNLIRALFFLNVWPTLNMHEHADPKTFESTILANWWCGRR